MLVDEPPASPRPVTVVPVGEAGEPMALIIAEVLRNNGCAVDVSYSGNLSRRMRYANRVNARAALLIGDEEAAGKFVTWRDLDSGEQAKIPMIDQSLPEIVKRIKSLVG